MFESEIRVSRFMLHYAHRLMEDIADAELARAPAAGVHTPLWIIGHLIFAADRGLIRTGGTPRCPESWSKVFGPGSAGDGSGLDVTPTKDELLKTLDEAYAAFYESAAKAAPAAMEASHGVALFADTPLKTMGDAVVHLLTSHFGVHLGQLSLWRRLNGRPPLF